jgi:hypothetical protein
LIARVTSELRSNLPHSYSDRRVADLSELLPARKGPDPKRGEFDIRNSGRAKDDESELAKRGLPLPLTHIRDRELIVGLVSELIPIGHTRLRRCRFG